MTDIFQMMLSFEPAPTVLPRTVERGTIDERFARFDEANPWVWTTFERCALELIRAGRQHFSADAILHTVRFHYALQTTSDDGFKINNDFSSRYARKWARVHPEHAEFFQYRRLTECGSASRG